VCVCVCACVCVCVPMSISDLVRARAMLKAKPAILSLRGVGRNLRYVVYDVYRKVVLLAQEGFKYMASSYRSCTSSSVWH